MAGLRKGAKFRSSSAARIPDLPAKGQRSEPRFFEACA
jgi:hypothetical protein